MVQGDKIVIATQSLGERGRVRGNETLINRL
jgi:hypothetical protein